jgi:site-specific recombinase XerD
MKVKEAASQFLADLAMTKSENTVSSYGTALNHLCSCCGERDVSEITADVVPEYVRWLSANNPVSQSSLNLYLVALSRFYRWLVLGRYVEEDLVRFGDWVSQYQKKIRRRKPKVPAEENVQALLSRIREARPNPERPEAQRGRDIILRWLRDRALIETLRATGCRIDEAVTLTVGDAVNQRAVVEGKGDKERTVFWDEAGWTALSEYLEARGDPPEYPLFARHDWKAGGDEHISTQGARSILAEWCRKAHVPVITPHQFRHRFATFSLRVMDLAHVQDLMGHESPETTRIYTQFQREELEAAHAQAEY